MIRYDRARVMKLPECASGMLMNAHSQALRVSDPDRTSFRTRWPFYKSGFNSKAYTSLQVILSDIEAILTITLEDRFGIRYSDFKDYSVVLVIPDLWDRNYVRHWTNLLLSAMGFKQFCAQQVRIWIYPLYNHEIDVVLYNCIGVPGSYLRIRCGKRMRNRYWCDDDNHCLCR